jgi:hypothetical protein
MYRFSVKMPAKKEEKPFYVIVIEYIYRVHIFMKVVTVFSIHLGSGGNGALDR